MIIIDFKAIFDIIFWQFGVYWFIDEEDIILYVGKAKNLCNWVFFYFGQCKDCVYCICVMVKNVCCIEFIVVEIEVDVFLLENIFIKKYQFWYNVMLWDDKSYFYICIKKEWFFWVFIIWRVVWDGFIYFGFYISKGWLKIIFEFIKWLFFLRICSYNLFVENIEVGKFKVCLEYYIKNCMGFCEVLESEEVYNEKIDQVCNILKGNFGVVK